MKSAYFVEKNKMEVREFPKAQLVKETDAIIKMVLLQSFPKEYRSPSLTF